MDSSKDYYFILGVYPGVNLDVIDVSYQLLSLYYSPVQLEKNNTLDNQKINELDEAYFILSDDNNRAGYDQSREEKSHLAKIYFGSDLNLEPLSIASLDGEWAVATDKYPELLELEQNLKDISWRLSVSFKTYLLDKKLFIPRRKIAHQLETAFLANFFSADSDLMDFGKMLLIRRQREAANQLNQIIFNSPEVIIPDKIIHTVLLDYPQKSDYLNHLLIDCAVKLKPDLVKVYLKAGADVNVLVDGSQSLLSYFVYLYGFMRYRGYEVEIANRYEIERTFSKYGAKKINIEKQLKKKLVDNKARKKRYIKGLIFITLFCTWLASIYVF
ncbi:MAG: DnaJ domain-containing protein [Pseudomonadota bacterium]